MTNPYISHPARITEIVNETPDKQTRSFRLSFLDPEDRIRFRFRAGQFAQLSIPGQGEIPIGIASSPSEDGDLLFTVHRVGRVTSALHGMHVGDCLGIRGPYGNGFPWEVMEGKTIVVVGGGFAFTTLRAAIAHMLTPGTRARFQDICVIYGCRSPEGFLYRAQLKDWQKRGDISLHLTVDDPGCSNWRGHVGLVPQIVREVAPSGGDDIMAIMCGPQAMIKFSVLALREMRYPPPQMFLSLENRMKCGIGICGRCNIGKDFVCKDGPVFTLAELAYSRGDL